MKYKSTSLIVASLFLYLTTWSQVDLQNGLVACYPFQGNASDLSGLSHHGTVYGATLTTDRFGNNNSAYLFNGVSSFIEVTSPVVSSREFTISFWAKTLNFQSQIAFMLVPDNVSDRFAVSVNYHHSADSSIFWDFGDIFGSGRSYTYPVTYLSKWEHYIFMSSASKDSMLVWRDNILQIAVPYSDVITDTSRALRIGSGDNWNYFNGIINDIKIYNRALNVGEVTALFRNENSCEIATDISVAENLTPKYLIYPNPCTGQFSVTSTTVNGEVSMTLRNLLGEVILQETFIGKKDITLTASKGIYFIELNTSGERTINKIIVE